mgnify:CR=1 FL=1
MDATLLERIGRWQDALVLEKRLPMAMSLISYNGKTQYFHASGYANVETTPVEIFILRILLFPKSLT